MRTCIYCKRDNSATTFEGVEHVIPEAFGTFGSETPTLDCVCDECNRDFGMTIDIYLARETVEGVVRYRKGISSSEVRPQKHLKITLDAGPETGQFAGMRVAIDGTRGELMRPLAQFQNSQPKDRPVRDVLQDPAQRSEATGRCIRQAQ
jgi:hypothetical protein